MVKSGIAMKSVPFPVCPPRGDIHPREAFAPRCGRTPDGDRTAARSPAPRAVSNGRCDTPPDEVRQEISRRDLDLALAANLDNKANPSRPLFAVGNSPLERLKPAGSGDEHPESVGRPGEGIVERLDRLRAEPQTVAVGARLRGQQDARIALEQVPALRQKLAEHGDLETSRGVGELDEGKAIALGRGALLLALHESGEPHRLTARPACERRRGRHSQPIEPTGVFVEWMFQMQSKRLECVRGALGFRPVGNRGAALRLGILGPRFGAEQVLLVAGPVVGRLGSDSNQRFDAFEHLSPVGVERVERAGAHEIFHLTLIGRLVAQAANEIEFVRERAGGLPLGDHIGHRLGADILDRGERIAHRATIGAVANGLDGELDPREIDVGWQQGNVEPLELVAKDVELVGIAKVEGHRRGEELDGIVGLEIGGLVGDHGIRRGMALVESITCELFDLFKDHLRLRRGDAAFLGTVDESSALGLHL